MRKMKKNILKYPSYEDELIADLKKNPRRAAAYLDASLEAFYEDGNTDAFLLALRHLAAAQGGFSVLAKKTSLNRQALYRMLSRSGNPRLDTLGTVINALGFQLTVKPKINRRAQGA